jgi:drug/metabolite transporter (DMT)-like permease
MPVDATSRVPVYALLIVVGALGAISDAILNEWARRGRLSWLFAAYASWIVVATLLGFILRRGYFNFGAAVVLFLLSNSVAALILDHRLLGGRLNGWGWIGIGLSVAGIICVELGRPHQQPAQKPSHDNEMVSRQECESRSPPVESISKRSPDVFRFSSLSRLQ